MWETPGQCRRLPSGCAKGGKRLYCFPGFARPGISMALFTILNVTSA